MRPAHYYHVFAVPGWERIVQEHLDAVQASGLDAHLDCLHLGIVGDQDERRKVEAMCAARIPTVVVDQAVTGWEQVTMDQMQANLRRFDVVLYAHTKGVTEPGGFNELWRRSMTHAVVTGWARAIALLDKHDAVGCHWLEPNAWPWPVEIPYFGGNFWWARSDWLAKLDPLRQDGRHYAECWIGSKEGIRVYDLAPGWPGMGTIIRLDDSVPTCQVSSHTPT